MSPPTPQTPAIDLAHCPHCRSTLQPEATCCPACTRRAVSFRLCNSCREPIDQAAKLCPYCRTKHEPMITDDSYMTIDMEIRANPIGGFLSNGLTALFLPPTIAVSKGRITVTKWSFFGLRIHHQEIQLSRIASVRHTKGVIWGSLLVETFGGAGEDIRESGLGQEDAYHMAEAIKQCIED